jgi:hypothetical protein
MGEHQMVRVRLGNDSGLKVRLLDCAGRRRRLRVATAHMVTVLALSWGVFSPASVAAVFTLTNENSTVSIDTSSNAGLFDWVVDGADVAARQWYWYRVGASGGESSIDTLTQIAAALSDVDGDSLFDRLTVRYTNSVSKFTVQVQFTLQGGLTGSKASDAAEIITIKNVGTAPLDFHFFQYSDFDLSLGNDDIVSFLNAATAIQTNANGAYITTAVASPGSGFEANLFPLTFMSLTNSTPTTLSNAVGPLTNNVTFAFQWDTTIAAGSSFIITVDQNAVMIPEPHSVLLTLAGLGVLGLARGRRFGRSNRRDFAKFAK